MTSLLLSTRLSVAGQSGDRRLLSSKHYLCHIDSIQMEKEVKKSEEDKLGRASMSNLGKMFKFKGLPLEVAVNVVYTRVIQIMWRVKKAEQGRGNSFEI